MRWKKLGALFQMLSTGPGFDQRVAPAVACRVLQELAPVLPADNSAAWPLSQSIEFDPFPPRMTENGKLGLQPLLGGIPGWRILKLQENCDFYPCWRRVFGSFWMVLGSSKSTLLLPLRDLLELQGATAEAAEGHTLALWFCFCLSPVQ